jgi:hypothetical protein
VRARMGQFGLRFAVVAGVIAMMVIGCAGTTPTPEAAIQDASKELRQAVTGNVEDAGRREQMLALVDQIEATQRSFSAQAADFAAQYTRMNADYDAPRARFEQLFSAFNGQRMQSRDRVLELHFRLSALATEKEWKSIGKAEAKLYEDAQLARAETAGGA